jgi:hypothetical protein
MVKSTTLNFNLGKYTDYKAKGMFKALFYVSNKYKSPSCRYSARKLDFLNKDSTSGFYLLAIKRVKNFCLPV